MSLRRVVTGNEMSRRRGFVVGLLGLSKRIPHRSHHQRCARTCIDTLEGEAMVDMSIALRVDSPDDSVEHSCLINQNPWIRVRRRPHDLVVVLLSVHFDEFFVDRMVFVFVVDENTRLASRFVHHARAIDRHVFVNGFTHVIDCQASA